MSNMKNSLESRDFYTCPGCGCPVSSGYPDGYGVTCADCKLGEASYLRGFRLAFRSLLFFLASVAWLVTLAL